MIVTFFLTLAIESFVVIVFCCWRRKAVLNILLTLSLANLLTQSLLWLALRLFYSHYLLTLYSAELLIWLFESMILYWFPSNRLTWREALALSLAANAASFGIGWFLPV